MASQVRSLFGFHLLVCALVLGPVRWSAADLAVSDFSMYDIWADNLMPMELFSRYYQWDFRQASPANVSSAGRFSRPPPLGGNMSDVNAALGDMIFHRQKINEFLATDYVVQSLLHDAAREKSKPIGKRMGVASNESASFGAPRMYGNHKLLNDEGMTKYKSWIERTNTLDDIRRHLGAGVTGAASHLAANRRQSLDGNEEEFDFEDGDITGYALSNNPNPYNDQADSVPNLPNVPNMPNVANVPNVANLPNLANIPNVANMQLWPFMPLPTAVSPVPDQLNAPSYPIMRAISKNGYDSGYEDYGSHAPVHTSYTAPAEIHPPSKEITIKDITDIALTTLAFLSFGMFVLQILMCITIGKDDTSNLAMMPMEMDDTDVPGDGTEEIRRMRRSTSDRGDRLMNELARRALMSIDAVLAFTEDEGKCHFYTLCENNKFAKSQSNGQKLWIPVWSMGVSWLASKVQPPSESGNYGSVLKSLHAIVVGVGKGDCARMYKNACEKS